MSGPEVIDLAGEFDRLEELYAVSQREAEASLVAAAVMLGRTSTWFPGQRGLQDAMMAVLQAVVQVKCVSDSVVVGLLEIMRNAKVKEASDGRPRTDAD